MKISANPKFGKDFYSLNSALPVKQVRILDADGSQVHCIKNRPGETASLSIYAELARKFSGKLNIQSALYGLNLYGDYVMEEKATPNSHPNIRRLISIIDSGHPLTLVIDD